MDQSDIADYVATSIVDPISRVEGVGGTNVFGSSYAMRIWLDPAKLRAYNLIPSDVSSAIRSQNVQVSAGQLGTLPTNTDRVVINATVSVQSYLQTPEQFEDILLKQILQALKYASKMLLVSSLVVKITNLELSITVKQHQALPLCLHQVLMHLRCVKRWACD